MDESIDWLIDWLIDGLVEDDSRDQPHVGAWIVQRSAALESLTGVRTGSPQYDHWVHRGSSLWWRWMMMTMKLAWYLRYHTPVEFSIFFRQNVLWNVARRGNRTLTFSSMPGFHHFQTRLTTFKFFQCLILSLCALFLLIGIFQTKTKNSNGKKILEENFSGTKPRKNSQTVVQLKPERRRGEETPLLVHYVRFYEQDPTAPGSNSTYLQLCYLECLGLLSVMVHIRHVQIHIHSNFPAYIPHESCRDLKGNWSAVRMVYKARRTSVGGKAVEFIQHAADMAKLEIVRDFGGIAMDYDVYLLKDKKIRNLLKRFDCIITQEFPTMMNAGQCASFMRHSVI